MFKCVHVLCTNCGTQLHYGYFDIPVPTTSICSLPVSKGIGNILNLIVFGSIVMRTY